MNTRKTVREVREFSLIPEYFSRPAEDGYLCPRCRVITNRLTECKGKLMCPECHYISGYPLKWWERRSHEQQN